VVALEIREQRANKRYSREVKADHTIAQIIWWAYATPNSLLDGD